MVCINGEIGGRRWKMGKCYIGELEEYLKNMSDGDLI